MAEGITGQALHQLLKNPQWTADSWDALLPVSQKAYSTMAERLNAQYLAPLQGLVRDWQELMQAHDEMSVMSLAEIEGWNKDWEELKKRTRELLNGEQKEG